MSVQDRMKVLLGESEDTYKQANKFTNLMKQLGDMAPVVSEMLDRAEKAAAKGGQSAKHDLPFLQDLAALLKKHKNSLFLYP